MEKKIYADYHGPRCTREYDGKLGHWKFSGTARKSRTKENWANHNADCIVDSGLHDVAAQAYPLVGMQSQRDPDYLEYQILTAKLAHVDGFFVEWGFQEHESNRELQILMEQAEKYDFEIGINWCDAWHYYPWIEAFHPEAVTREKKTELFAQNMQYLLDTLYSSKVGAKFNRHPLIFLFGGGLMIEEFRKIKESPYKLPDGTMAPLFLVRAPIVGEERDGQVCYWLEKSSWTEEADGLFAWIPMRVRNGLVTEGFQKWDRYGTTEDSVAYLESLKKGGEETESKVRISCVNPEMDNRACASWNKFDLSYIPRDGGKTYEAMWKYNVKHRDDVDIVYIVSWNDYTECHQIEPTLRDGYREVVVTKAYAAQFKGIADLEQDDWALPLYLFQLRKKARKLGKAGYDVKLYLDAMDQAAQSISNRKTEGIEAALKGIGGLLGELEERLKRVQLTLSEKTETLVLEEERICILSPEAIEYMETKAFDAWLSFSYYDGTGDLQMFHGDDQLCDIRMDGEESWKQTEIRIFQENMKQIGSDPVIYLAGEGMIRDVSLELRVYHR